MVPCKSAGSKPIYHFYEILILDPICLPANCISFDGL